MPYSRVINVSVALLSSAFAAAAMAQKSAEADDAVRWSGFLSETLAYTYADPSHWSRGVTRFQLSAEGRFAGGSKWKIGGRVDADPIINNSSFYLDRVQRDQRVDYFWRETYVDFSAGNWEFRLGAQNIVWGEVVGLFFADVVSARDLREFLLPSFDVIRKPQWAARGEYFFGDSKIELVWIPVPTFDDIGKPGSDFYPLPLPSPTPEVIANQFRDPQRPARSLDNSNFGLRAGTLIDGWDLSAFVYRSFATSPTFYRVSPSVFEPRYDRITQVGATVSKDLGSLVLRAEMIHGSGQNFSTVDSAAPLGVVERRTFDWIASAEMPFESIDGRLNVQIFKRHYFGGSDDGLVIDTGDFGASFLVAAKVTPNIEPSLLWIQGFGGAGSMIRPMLTWTGMRNLSVTVGTDIFAGPSNGLFGRYGNRDRAYVEARYSF